MSQVPGTEANADVAELYQEAEPAAVAVPVKGEGTFFVVPLPAKRAQPYTDAVPAGRWTPLLPGTPKRSRTVLISTDQAFYYSPTGTGSTGFTWPANVPLELRNSDPVWVQSAHATNPATISHLTELWAD